MRIYFSVVRRWWVAPAALSLTVLVCWTTGGTELPVPSFLGGTGGAKLRYFAPLLVVMAVLYCLDRRLGEVESTAVAPVSLRDHATVTGVVVLAHAAGPWVGMDVPRNVMLLLAVALTARRFMNTAAAGSVCLGALAVTVVMGRGQGPSGQVVLQEWALVIHPSDSGAAWVAAVILFTLALAVSSGAGRFPPPMRAYG
ncbi:hypothetical protein GT204_31025 [Streptomyces sp. SID4919]|uniref:hypothetical protein n=1 Tax=unclassified Streptomyces TaxID=2593676 RepID=UPI000823D538|nr:MULTISPECIES: hypothetical protein [unclassified Streptomyces]MYY13199.1 hypothetical protein [Streptomyces sp. SID4919]SCK38503.1 hypothetical protein YW7DRAFT_03267 [Streptomyces sp. AmelKG-E11A]